MSSMNLCEYQTNLKIVVSIGACNYKSTQEECYVDVVTERVELQPNLVTKVRYITLDGLQM
jgi:hypothetical protein